MKEVNRITKGREQIAEAVKGSDVATYGNCQYSLYSARRNSVTNGISYLMQEPGMNLLTPQARNSFLQAMYLICGPKPLYVRFEIPSVERIEESIRELISGRYDGGAKKAQAILKKRTATHSNANMDPNAYREQFSRKYAFSCMVKCRFCGASLTRRSWHSGSRYNKSVWFCISSSKYGKKNCPESKAIPEEVLESAFVESYRIITDDHKDVLEEFLQRTEAELHSDATLLEIERVKKELAQLDQKMQRLLDMHLDQKIDFGTYQDKKLEITKEQQLKTTELKQLQGEADVEKDLHKRIDAMRKLLTDAPVLKEFDRNVFESIVEKVIVGGYDEAGNADPSMITFVYKTGFEDKKSGDDYKHPRRNAKPKKLPSLPKDENSVLPQPSKDDACGDRSFVFPTDIST